MTIRNGITFETQVPVPVPLPSLGLCGHCEGEIRLRKNGTLYAHHCPGDGKPPAARLEPTFVRWLYAQSSRRDRSSNPITNVAQRTFHGCTLGPKSTTFDMAWTTAEELHDSIHARLAELYGSDMRSPGTGQRCNGSCEEIETARLAHAALVAQRNGEGL